MQSSILGIKNRGYIYIFLNSIRPIFPGFLSEYKSATYLGLSEGLVSLFQNSKTIRNIFSRLMKRLIWMIKLDYEVKAEIQGAKSIIDIVKRSHRSISSIWTCSSELADKLRTISWGGIVVGATVPPPFEMIQLPSSMSKSCSPPAEINVGRACVSVLVPRGIPPFSGKRGQYKSYIGSRSAESTSLLRPWEIESKVPLIKRTADLRKSFNWFVDPTSSVGQSITNNLNALTGEDWGELVNGAKRSGSELHRFSCSRQSQGHNLLYLGLGW